MNLARRLTSVPADSSHSIQNDQNRTNPRFLMALKVDATFEDGVFVPARRPVLAHGDRVRLTIEPAAPAMAAAGSNQDGSLINPGSRTDHALALALDFHPDGC
jgi:hypothetical protein